MEQEGFVIGVKAFVRAIIESLRAICRFVFHIPVAIDGYEILTVQAERIAVRASKARPFEIDRSMNIHGHPPIQAGTPGRVASAMHHANFTPAGLRCSDFR
jgi:hypothetical protein